LSKKVNDTQPVEQTAVETTEKAPWTEEVKVYIGPTLPGAARGTVYSDGISTVLKDAAAETPAINNLIVPLAKLAVAQTDLADPESGRSRIYRLVADKYKHK